LGFPSSFLAASLFEASSLESVDLESVDLELQPANTRQIMDRKVGVKRVLI